MEAVSNIIKNVLTALYETSGFSAILAVLFMFFYMYVRRHGLKQAQRRWIEEFRTSAKFRWVFALAFYTALLLFRTLLNRNLWQNPLSDVLGGWTLTDKNGEFISEPIENVMLFMPFAVFALGVFKDRLLKKQGLKTAVWQSAKIVFIFSFSVEMLQLFLRLGTFQISDLVYNTLGGALGGAVYWLGKKIKAARHRSACPPARTQA